MRVFFAAISLSLALAFSVQAAGLATRCVFTIKKIEFKSKDGDWKMAFEGSLPIDIAVLDPVARFDNNGRVPEGKYVSVRLTVDETVEVAGADLENMTLEDGEIELIGTASTLDGLPGEIQAIKEIKPTHTRMEPGPIRVTIDFDFADRDKTMEIVSTRDFDKPFMIKAASEISIQLSARLDAAIVHLWPDYYSGFPSKDVMVFNFPDYFTDFSIRVDGSRSSAKGKIEVKF